MNKGLANVRIIRERITSYLPEKQKRFLRLQTSGVPVMPILLRPLTHWLKFLALFILLGGLFWSVHLSSASTIADNSTNNSQLDQFTIEQLNHLVKFPLLSASSLPTLVFQENGNKLHPDDAAAFDRFGWSTAISGDYAIVGAPPEVGSILGYRAGSAYIFKREETGWVQQAKLTVSDPTVNDQLGFSVAISGNYAAVGTWDVGTIGGAVYVFERNGENWPLQAKLVADDIAGSDHFGSVVAIHGDYVIAGSYADDDNGSVSGSAYIFKRNGNEWGQNCTGDPLLCIQSQKLIASDATAGDAFGWSVAIGENYAVVGATGDSDNGTSSGSAYIFERNGDTWGQAHKLIASDGAAYDYFGSGVSVSGNTIVVGAYGTDDNGSDSGSAYIFERDGNDWVQQAKLSATDNTTGDRMGSSVAISGDYIIAGAWGDSTNSPNYYSGAAYIFRHSGGNWGQNCSGVPLTCTQTQKILGAPTDHTTFYGNTVSISGDNAIVGARSEYDNGTDSGSAYIYETEKPISGLIATNNSPTEVGASTTFSTTITSGTNVTYSWAFGDGAYANGIEVGPEILHSYSAAGMYSTVVTASNSISLVTATTSVVITSPLIINKIGPSTAVYGDFITYTITITNPNIATATNLIITDTIPTSATYISGGTRVGDVVQWSEPTLPSQNSIQVNFTVTATETIVNNDYGVTTNEYGFGPGQQAIMTTIVGNSPLTNLTLTSDSPTYLGLPTTFTTSLTAPPVTLFFEDFETVEDLGDGFGFSGEGSEYIWYTGGGLWHLENPQGDCPPPAPNNSTVAHFGDTNCSYSYAYDDYIELVNPVTLPNSGDLILTFDSYQDLDCYVGGGANIDNFKIIGLASPLTYLPTQQGCPIYDRLLVEIGTNGGEGWNWNTLAQLNNNGQGWVTENLSLADYVGQDIKIRFYFDVDGGYVETLGWMIDNVAITSQPSTANNLFTENFETVEDLGDGFGYSGEGSDYVWYVSGGGESSSVWNLQGPGDDCPPPIPNSGTAIYFGDRYNCNYSYQNSDFLAMADSITLPASGNVVLSFDSYEDLDCIEYYEYQKDGTYSNKVTGLGSPLLQNCTIDDSLLVEISTTNGEGWNLLEDLGLTQNGNGWYTKNISLNDYLGQDINIRFYFNSGYGEHNALGWMIDNIAIADVTPPASEEGVIYTWNFGDGSPVLENGPVISHTYSASGIYTAMVTATNAVDTATATTTVQIDIPPIISVSPITIEQTLSPGLSLDVPLVISNAGALSLTWDIFVTDKSETPSQTDSYIVQISNDLGGPVFNWVDISEGGTSINGLTDDNYVGPIPIGFDFPYFGQTYTQFYVGSNGIIGFGPPNNYDDLSNTSIPVSYTPNNMIAWLWDDLYPDSGTVHYQVINNQLVIQFTDYSWCCGGGETITAQVILKPNGNILIQYQSFSAGAPLTDATIGIENQDGTQGVQAAYNEPFVTQNLAVLFTQPLEWLTLDAVSGTTLPGQTSSVTMTLDATDLLAGRYEADLTIQSNDPITPQLVIPVTLQIEEDPVTGLTLTGDSPILLGQSTTLTATITQGDNVEYTWDFGDGSLPLFTDETTVSHIYPGPGVYTAVVTAANSSSFETASTTVSIGAPLIDLTVTNNSPTVLAQPTTLTATALITGFQTLFFEDFESVEELGNGFGYPGEGSTYTWYTNNGIWNLESPTDNCPSLAPNNSTVAYFGDDSSCTYDSLGDDYLEMTQPVTLPASGEAFLSFWSYEALDCNDSGPQASLDTAKIMGLARLPNWQSCSIYDRLLVEISTNSGLSWDLLDELDNNGSGWYSHKLSLEDYLGQDIQIRFYFESNYGTHYTLGWMLDNIAITTLTPAIAADGVTYSWDFGDGAPILTNGPVVTHTYETSGTHTAIVTATNGINLLTTTTTVIVEEPVAGLAAISSGLTELESSTGFSATITAGSNVDYTWDFGDGNGGSGPYPSHTYLSVGSYTATVTASNTVSALTATTTVIVEEAINGLTALNDSPTELGQTTTLSTTITTGSNVSYTWDFGDGQTDNGATVSHSYTAAGNYKATVTASNAVSLLTATTNITVDEPITGLTAENDGPTASGTQTQLTATISTGTNVSYSWDFGDSSGGSGASPTHSYLTAGLYTATVTTSNGVSVLSQTTAVQVEDAITGLAATNDGPTPLGNTTELSATISTGTNVAYSWDFGDGASGTGALATRVYTSAGEYVATVVAGNAVSVMTATTNVTVDEPIAGLTAGNNSPTELGQTTALSATITAGTNVSYSWDFGDGAGGSGASPAHTYGAIGVYPVVVTATNSAGVVTDTTIVTITDVAITGLNAANDSPTPLGDPTEFVATITGGTNVIYNWDFGDGTSDSGSTVTHIYQAAGNYAAVVTASNSANIITAATTAVIPFPVDAGQSEITIIGVNKVAADGTATINVRVTARDQFGTVVPGATVELTSTASLSFTQPPATDANGRATGSVSSSQVVVAQIGAIVDGVALNDSVTATFEGADLNISKSGPAQVTAGYPLTYTLALANSGFLSATNVVVTDTLPSDVEFASENSGYPFAQNGNELVWQMGDLLAGQSTGNFNVVVTAPINSLQTIANQVVVGSDSEEIDVSNNSRSVDTFIEKPTPVLSVSPIYPTLAVTQGTTANLVITVRNAGTGIMTGTTVIPPPYLSDWTSVSQTDLGDLLPGESVTFTLQADTTNVSTRGHYRDRLTIETGAAGLRDVLLDIHVQGPRRNLQLTLKNNVNALVKNGDVILEEDILIVTEGITTTQPYDRRGFTDEAGQLTFAGLETDKEYYFDIVAAKHVGKTGSITVTAGVDTQAWVEVLTGLPGLTVTPGQLSIGMARGSLAQRELILQNPGAVTLTNISLTPPSDLPWVYLGQPPLDAVIPPGGELSVAINAAPTITESADVYNSSVFVSASNGNSATVPLEITLDDGLVRTLCFNVNTFAGGILTNGTVKLVDQAGQIVSTNGVTETVQQVFVKDTDSNGQVCFQDLNPGPYSASVGRGGSQLLGSKDIEVVPGVGTQEELIEVDEPSIVVNWSVTPTTIEDEYITVITSTFIPQAPPRLSVSPRSFSICDLITPESNGSFTDTVTIHNFYPVTFTNAVLDLQAIGDVKATITTTHGTQVSAIGDEYPSSLPLGTIGPNEDVTLTLIAKLGVDEDPPPACLYGDAGAVVVKVQADYKYYSPSFSWYGFFSTVPADNLPLDQESVIPLKLTNSGFPEEANQNKTPPAITDIVLTQPDVLTWITISPTTIISIPVGSEADLDLVVNPPEWLAEGLYFDEIQVQSTNGITALIGIEAEMSDGGLRVETNFVTPLQANEPENPPLAAIEAPEGRVAGMAYPLGYIPSSQGDSGYLTTVRQTQQNAWYSIIVNQNEHVVNNVDIFADSWTMRVIHCSCSNPTAPTTRPTWQRVGNQLVRRERRIGGASGGSSYTYVPEFKDNTVVLEVTQRFALEREAFNARLELINGLASTISDLNVGISIVDAQGVTIPLRQPGQTFTETVPITPNFPINSIVPTSTIFANMPDNWKESPPVNFTIIPETPTDLPNLGAAGSSSDRQVAVWTIVPDAFGITDPLGADFFVQAVINYTVNGIPKTITTTQELITVHPQPKITLDYYLPRYLYKDIPTDWLVVATNVGYGPAQNFSMEKPQPKVVKQSDQYPTSFTFEGPSKLVFSTIQPGEQKSQAWKIKADNSGLFIDFQSDCIHTNYLGVELPALVYCNPTIHVYDPPPPVDESQQWGKDNACMVANYQAFDSDPINTYSGNFTYNMMDVSIPTWGAPLEFERSYNSRDIEDGPLGPGWTHNLNMEMAFESFVPINGGFAQSLLSVRLPRGSRAHFEVSEDGNTITPLPGVTAELVRNLDVYTLTQKGDQTKYVFNAAQDLAAIEDGNGNRLTLTYSNEITPTARRLLAATGPAGRQLTFEYDANGHLVKMTDPLSRTMLYTYTNGYLTEATDFRGQTTRYTYTAPDGDIPGQLVSIIDANNNEEVYNHYDAARRVDWQRDALGQITSFSYLTDSNGNRATTMTYPLGNGRTDTYNSDGVLIEQRDSHGYFEQYEYDDTYRMTRLIDKNGHETNYTWHNACSVMAETTDPLGHTTGTDVNSQYQVTDITDERGFVTTIDYDSGGFNPITITDPLNNTQQFSYGPRGELLSKTDENGHTTFYGYDIYGNTTVITNALGNVTTMSYDLAGRLFSSADALGRQTGYSYDPGNNLLQVVDPLTGTSTFEYDAVGNRVAMTDALGRETTYQYDARYDLIQSTNPINDQQTLEYDANGNLTRETDENGRVTTYEYDGLDRLVKMTNALSGTMVYTYDPMGNRLTEQDANGNVTQYVYDANDRIIETIFPDGSHMTSVYDQADNLLSLTDGENRTVSYQYDALGRVTVMTDPLNGAVIYSYDAVGNQTGVTDAKGRITTYQYDALNRLIRTTNPLSGETELVYDAVGNLVSTTDAEGRATTMQYDELDRLAQITDPLSGTMQYSYDAVDNKLQEVDQLGRVTRYSYDDLNRLVQVTNPLSGTTGYQYDAVGNLTQITDPQLRTTTYQYDALNRQIAVTDALNGTIGYTYDANGNLLSETDQEGRTINYTYDAFNQLQTITDPINGTNNYAYDQVGNQISFTDANGHTTSYVYDKLDRLIEVHDPFSNTITYSYDARGNLLTKTDQENRTTAYSYDELDRLTVVTANYVEGSPQNADTNIQTHFAYDSLGNLLRLTLVNPDGADRVTTYAYDNLNRLIATTDPFSGTTSYAYDAVGNTTVITDPLQRRTVFDYDNLNRLIQTTNPAGGTTIYTYDAIDNLVQTTIVNPHTGNQTTRYDYDALDRLVQVTDALSGTTFFTYDRIGNQISQIDPEGRTTTYEYDDLNRLTRIESPIPDAVTIFDYDAVGNQTRIIRSNPSGSGDQTTRYEYDALNRLVKVSDPLDRVAEFIYDKVGNQIESIDAKQRVTHYDYDALDRLVEVIANYDASVPFPPPGGTTDTNVTTQYEYNTLGNLLSETDAEGRVTTYDYDSLDRLTEVQRTDLTIQYQYDAVGNLLRETQDNPTPGSGNQITFYEYDTLDRLVKTTNALSHTTTFTYDVVGNLLQTINANNQVTQFQYDKLNRLIQTTNALSDTLNYQYDAVGNLTQITDYASRVKRYDYDALNRLIQITENHIPNAPHTADTNVETHFTYDAVGNLLAQTDAKGRVTQYQYNLLNQLIQVTDPLAGVTTFAYDEVGNQVRQTNVADQTIDYEYDALDRLIKVTDPLAQVTRFEYDRVGNQVTLIDPKQRTTRTEYDALDRPVKEIANYVDGGPQDHQTNVETRFEYDAVGNLLRTVAVNPGHTDQVTRFEYDRLNRLIKTVNALDGVTTYTYDPLGNQTGMVNPKDQTTNYTYDTLNRLIAETNALSGTTAYSYDSLGNLVELTNAKGQVLRTEYDGLNRPIQVIANYVSGGSQDHQTNVETQFTYDAVGNQLSVTDAKNHTTTYTYDALDRVTSAQRGVFNNQYSYDALGNLLTQTDANGHTTGFNYDDLNRLVRVTNPLSQSTRYEYDALGNNTAVVDPLNRRTEFAYDTLDRLTTVTDPLARITSYQYDALGNNTAIMDAEGVETRYQYDPLNRLTTVIENYAAGGPQDHQTNVTTEIDYDALGNLTAITDPLGYVSTFAYDDLNRLIDYKDSLLHQTTYTYDALGNLTEMVDPKMQITGYDYDPLNRLVNVNRPDETVTFTYDAVGNRLAMTDNTGLTAYAYDTLDRLVQVQDPLNQVVQYGYDPVGNRTSLNYPDNSQVSYTYDPANRLVTVEDWDAGLTQYTYDAAGQLMEMIRPTTLTGTGGITSTYTYDEAGQLTLLQHQSISGTLSSFAYSYDNVGNRIQAVENILTPILNPTAVFTATPLVGLSPLTVTFTNASLNATDFIWHFGDGITQTLSITNYQYPEGTSLPITNTHTYTQPGFYTVTLIASGGQVTHTLTRTNYIAVIPPDAFQEENGQVVIEAEHFHERTSGLDGHAWNTRTGFSGFTGSSYVQARPDTGALYHTTELTTSSSLRYQLNFVTTGTYTIWLYGAATDAAGDSLHLDLSPLTTSQNSSNATQLTQLSGFAPGTWSWANKQLSGPTVGQAATVTVATPGPHTLTLWMREDGLRLDRILLTTNTTYIPVDSGPAESPRAAESGVSFVPPTSATQTELLTISDISYSSLAQAPPVPISPFTTNPILLIMGPLAIVAPFARRRRWRRYAWIIFSLLLTLGFLSAGPTIAANLTTDHRPLATYNTLPGGHLGSRATTLTPITIPYPSSSVMTGTTIIDYTYDPLYRLIGADYSSGEAYAYTYDAAGNRLTYAVNSTQVATYTYNAANWLTQVNGQAYTYDNNGNLLNDGQYSYTYDSANRLTQIQSPQSTIQNQYNGDGVRVAQIIDTQGGTGGIRTDYVQDVAAPLPQVLTARNGTATTRYLHGLGLIGEQQGGGSFSYHLPDALGSVRQIINPAGQILLSQRFDPFGGIETQHGIRNTNFGFTGEEQDSETGLVHLRARTYNPATGRFLQSDPVMGTPNQPRTLHHYAYAFNNPVNLSDPSGQMPPNRYQSLALTNNRQWSHSSASASIPVVRAYSQGYQNQRPDAPATRYATAVPTQLGYRNNPSGGLTIGRGVRSANNYSHSTYSDPASRHKSTGQRPQTCGLTDLIMGFGQSAMNGDLVKDAFGIGIQVAKQIPKTYKPLMNWVNNQVKQIKQAWAQADWRMGVSIGYGFVMGLALGALAASGVGLVGLGFAFVGVVGANAMFNALLYNDPEAFNLETLSNFNRDKFIYDFGANFAGGGVEMGLGLVGGAIGGAPGWLIGAMIGAGVGQITTNYFSDRPWDEFLLGSMLFSGVAEGIGGAIGHMLGDMLSSRPKKDGKVEPDVEPVNEPRVRKPAELEPEGRPASKQLSTDTNPEETPLPARLDENSPDRLHQLIDRVTELGETQKGSKEYKQAVQELRQELAVLKKQIEASEGFAPRGPAHHSRDLQLALIAALERGQALSVRSMDWGAWSWLKLGLEILFKPQAAAHTEYSGPAGYRETNAGIFIADADVAWATMADGTLMTNDYFVENIIPRVKTVLEVLGHKQSPVLHGPHMNVEAIFNSARAKLEAKYGVNSPKVDQVMNRFQRRYFAGHDLEFFTQDKYYKAEVYIYGRDYQGKIGYLGSGQMKATLDQFSPEWFSQPGGTVIRYPVPSPEKAFPSDPGIQAVLKYREAYGRFPSTVDEAIEQFAPRSTSANEVIANVHNEAVSPNAQSALRAKLSALEEAQATAARTRVLPDGRIRYYSAERPARKPGPTRGASYVTEWDPQTGNVRSWIESYNHAGEVERVHPKMINGQVVNAPHYPPTGSEVQR